VPVNERNPVNGRTALHVSNQQNTAEIAGICALLLDAGADANAADNRGRTPIFGCALSFHPQGPQALQILLERGAWTDVVDRSGVTPLLAVCSDCDSVRFRQQIIELLFRYSSVQTRRAVDGNRRSAVDCLVDMLRYWGIFSWHKQVIAQLLSSGASVLRQNASIVLPIAVSHGLPLAARNEAELAA
jgi:hypothetical protein